MADPSQLFSSASTISEKVSLSGLGEKLSSGLGKIGGALSSGASKVSLKIKSEFEKKDFKSPASIEKAAVKASLSPQEARANAAKFAGALSYPAEMKYYTLFSFKKYEKAAALIASKDLPSVSIILPLPAGLQENFAVEYETPALGPVTGAASDAVINMLRTGNLDYNVGSKGVMGTAKDVVNVMGSAGVAGGLSMLKKQGGAGEVAAAIGSKALGVAPNPHLAVIFTNIGLREHSFSYKFAPGSQRELQTLKNIIRELKVRMLPGMAGKGDMLFSYPDVCDISFGPTKSTPYKIKQCVMTALTVNYSPAGTPAFFKTGDPVMVEISMTFKEVSPFTRDDIDPLTPSNVAGTGQANGR